MKFIIEQKVFHKALQKVNRAVSTKGTLPILSGILLQASSDNSLKLTATDLEIGISHNLSANVIKEGEMVLPAKELSNIIRELPAEPIEVEINEENFSAKIETSNSNFSLKCLDPEEFPSLPEVDEMISMNLAAAELKEMIDCVKFACSKKESRPGLTGSLLTINPDKLIMVSTNTYRMAYKEKPNQTAITEEYRAILPAKTLQELSRLLPEVIEKDGNSEEEEETESNDSQPELEKGKVKIKMDASHCYFILNDILLTSRLIEGKFPNYNQVMPAEFNSEVIVDRKGLQQAVKRVSLMADVIKLDFVSDADELILQSADSEIGHAKEKLAISMEGESQNINVDASYIQDVLKVLTEDEVKLKLIGPLNPMAVEKIETEDYTYLIMPIRPGSN